MRHLVVVLSFLVILPKANAIVRTSVEPVVGYERVQKLTPVPRTRDRLVYGLRATAGIPLVSAEGEVLRSQDNEDFPTQSISTKETTDRARLGLRSTIRLVSVISLVARAGAQAKRNQTETTTNGVTARTEDPITYRPYAGAGLRVRLGRNISLTGELTTVFNNFPSMNDNEYQLTSGFAIEFP